MLLWHSYAVGPVPCGKKCHSDRGRLIVLKNLPIMLKLCASRVHNWWCISLTFRFHVNSDCDLWAAASCLTLINGTSCCHHRITTWPCFYQLNDIISSENLLALCLMVLHTYYAHFNAGTIRAPLHSEHQTRSRGGKSGSKTVRTPNVGGNYL